MFNRLRLTVLLALVSLLGVTTELAAHGYDAGRVPGTQVDAAISVTWRDTGSQLANGIWQIPGVLMGGEAYPVTEGTSLDEARISVLHRTPQQVFAGMQVSSHDNGAEAELHHAYAGLDLMSEKWVTTLAVGRMSAAITPANQEHASDRLFSETPLALDAFLGRQLNDEGGTLVFARGPLRLGFESWRGSAFPATPGEDGGSWDAYVHYQVQRQKLAWHLGVWYLQSDAVNRVDDRYVNGGHQHGGAGTLVAPDYGFTGGTDMGGAFVRLGWQWSEAWSSQLEAQWLQQQVEGRVFDSTRSAQLKSDAEGGWLQLALHYHQHQIGLRWERLVMDNNMSGAAAEDLAGYTGLLNTGYEPERVSWIYANQIRPQLLLRCEVIEDQLPAQTLRRYAVGLVWRGNLLDTK